VIASFRSADGSERKRTLLAGNKLQLCKMTVKEKSLANVSIAALMNNMTVNSSVFKAYLKFAERSR